MVAADLANMDAAEKDIVRLMSVRYLIAKDYHNNNIVDVS